MPGSPSGESCGSDRGWAGNGLVMTVPHLASQPCPASTRAKAMTVGIEEEVLLLDPESHALAPVADAALRRLGGDPRFVAELPAGQLEIRLPPAASALEAVAGLRAARRDLAEALHGLARPAGSAVHPGAPGTAPLNRGARYERLRAEFGRLAERQQVCALQVHVAVGDRTRTIAVHDALRTYLPDIAALAANGPMYEGCDTGFASIRPLLCRLLPRQGVPPVLGDPVAFDDELAWGARSGALGDPTLWWWELRPHPVHGTLEIRVADTQTTLGQTTAVVALVHALVATLSARLETEGSLPVAPTWRIEQNRWAACRDGLGATFADVYTGERTPVADRLRGLVADVTPAAERLGCARALGGVLDLLDTGGGAAWQRSQAAATGIGELPARLADRFGDETV
ncbi:MAG: carboxylate-amine ligase [Solirubrobacteraceae bacterium]